MIVMVYTLTAAFGLFTSSLASFHIYLILSNKSTLESEALDNYNPFNMGTRANWEQIFGTNAWLWFLPVVSKDAITGLEYPKSQAQLINSLL